MKKMFDDQLKKAACSLPGYKAKPESWSAIEQYLDFRDKLNEVKNDLPVYKAPDAVWLRLANVQGKRSTQKFLILWKNAAAVLFLAGCWFVFQTYSGRKLSYTTEVATGFNPELSFPSDSSIVQVTEFIEQQCRNNTYICSEHDFSVKKQKLEEVNHEIEKLDEVIKTLGSSESLVKTRISLENYKAELIKDLIKKLTS